MIVLCMRHGQTNYNLLGLCNDDPSQDVLLTELGIRQAEGAATELKDVPIERIFVSELPRTQETAETINRYHAVPVTVHSDINDIRTGFDGKPVSEYFAAVDRDRLTITPPGGESLLEYKRRVLRFLHWLRQQREKTVLVIAHEETLRVITAFFRDLPDDEMLALQFGNCEIITFEYQVDSD